MFYLPLNHAKHSRILLAYLTTGTFCNPLEPVPGRIHRVPASPKGLCQVCPLLERTALHQRLPTRLVTFFITEFARLLYCQSLACRAEHLRLFYERRTVRK